MAVEQSILFSSHSHVNLYRTRQTNATGLSCVGNMTKPSDDSPASTGVRGSPVASLLLTSYSHATRLRPTPDLRYDLRTARLPSRDVLRDRTGISKRVRERVLRFEDFSQLLALAETEIRSTMKDRRAGQRPTHRALQESAPNTKPAARAGRTRDGAGFGPDDGAGDGEEIEREDAGRPVLSVGAFCMSGHHRSVAFVEELAGKMWPEGWEVRVNHRELQGSREAARDRGEKDREQRRRDQRCSARQLAHAAMSAPGLDTRD